MPPDERRSNATLVWVVLGGLYFVWGTTYLGIEKVNETAPTLIGAAVRFLFAGSVLFGWSTFRSGERTNVTQWRAAGTVGVFLVLGGNALVAVSENMGTPTGVVSLIIALIPLWLALFDRVLLRSAPLGPRVVAGLLGGFAGAALLIGGNALAGHAPLGGMLVAVAATVLWATGSLYARRAALPGNALLGSGMQQLVGGAAILAVAIASGELGQLHVGQISRDSWLGLAWLVVAGSFVGFSSYLWLLRNARTSLVSTYAFVNPVVAVTLGWLVLNEALTARVLVAGLVILVSVALIVSAGGTARTDLGGDVEAVAPPSLVSDADEQGGSQVQTEI
jgi:drug/metabolite transporter (DMT)-like permease